VTTQHTTTERLQPVELAAMEANKLAEIASHERDKRQRPAVWSKPFHPEWHPDLWTKWAVVDHALRALGVQPGARVLDVGCGPGWTSLFLSEAGYRVLGIDIAPAHVEISRGRAQRWSCEDLRFAQADMDAFALDELFDVVLVFDALHHSARQRQVIRNIAHHLAPGGWVLFGEPSLLHAVSPGARRTHRQTGWIERGIGARQLRRDCEAAGLGEVRRFHEGTYPYESRVRGFGWQLLRLTAANVAFAPQSSIWLAARKPLS
jgi:2-polyprenyl-3-methyl-5-hydroxy-6-metoxy-1,4-benzoquinol methylase